MPRKTTSSRAAGHRFKRDVFKADRGGRSVFLDVSCDRCGTHVVLYQKDGPGPLKRLYLDRMFAPPAMAALQSVTSVKKLSPLCCSDCDELLAMPMMYEKESRLAYRLFQSVVKTARNRKIRQRLPVKKK